MNGLTGTVGLLRLALRRDRIRVPVWAISLAVLTAYTAVALDTVYPTAADRQARGLLMQSPAAVILSGPGFGVADYTRGAMVANELVLTLLVAICVMSILLVTRHTRAEEENGRSELVRATRVARGAPLAAALGLALIANAAVGVLVVLALVVSGLGGLSAVAVGLGLALTGMVFAAVAAVTGQLTEHARTASGAALGVLAVAFLLRGLADVAGSPVVWASAIAWPQQVRPYVDLRWWPLLLSLVAALALVAVASAVLARRDFGAGVLATRRGPASARPALAGPVALAFRQQRGALVGWAVALLLIGASTGSLAASVDDLLESNNAAQEFLSVGAADLIDAFVGTMVLFVALGVGAFGVLAVLRWRDEESAGRAEAVLATSVSRWRWLAGALSVALVGALVLLLAGGLGLGVSAAVALGDASVVWSSVGAALSYLPAVATLVGLTTLLYGVGARWATWAWLVVAYAVLVGLFGGLLRLPSWAERVSPFGATPLLPAVPLDVLPLVLLAVVAVALTWAGGRLFAQRDVAAG